MGTGWKAAKSPSPPRSGGTSAPAGTEEGLDWFGDLFGADGEDGWLGDFLDADLAGPANWTLEGDLLEMEGVEESMAELGGASEELEALGAELEKMSEQLESMWLGAPLEDELDFFGDLEGLWLEDVDALRGSAEGEEPSSSLEKALGEMQLLEGLGFFEELAKMGEVLTNFTLDLAGSIAGLEEAGGDWSKMDPALQGKLEDLGEVGEKIGNGKAKKAVQALKGEHATRGGSLEQAIADLLGETEEMVRRDKGAQKALSNLGESKKRCMKAKKSGEKDWKSKAGPLEKEDVDDLDFLKGFFRHEVELKKGKQKEAETKEGKGKGSPAREADFSGIDRKVRDMWEESEMARKCGVHLKLLCKATPPAASPLMFESETVSTNATSSKLKEPFTIFRNLPSDTSVSCSTLQDLVPGCGESEKAEKQRAELARAFTEEMAALGELRAHDLLAFEGSECAESETCQYALAEGWVEVDAVKMKTGSGKEVEHLARGGKKKKKKQCKNKERLHQNEKKLHDKMAAGQRKIKGVQEEKEALREVVQALGLRKQSGAKVGSVLQDLEEELANLEALELVLYEEQLLLEKGKPQPSAEKKTLIDRAPESDRAAPVQEMSVKVTTALDGVTLDTFNEQAFIAVFAERIGEAHGGFPSVPPSDVTVTAVREFSPTRRAMLAAGVRVDTEVAAKTEGIMEELQTIIIKNIQKGNAQRVFKERLQARGIPVTSVAFERVETVDDRRDAAETNAVEAEFFEIFLLEKASEWQDRHDSAGGAESGDSSGFGFGSAATDCSEPAGRDETPLIVLLNIALGILLTGAGVYLIAWRRPQNSAVGPNPAIPPAKHAVKVGWEWGASPPTPPSGPPFNPPSGPPVSPPSGPSVGPPKPPSGDPPVPPSGQPPARPSGDPPKPPSGDPPKPPSGDAPHPPSGGPPGPPPGPPPRKGKEEEPVIV